MGKRNQVLLPVQELRSYLQSHRSWLSGLWTASGGTPSFEGRQEQAVLLSQLLGSLLKCCDPEVSLPCPLKFHETPDAVPLQAF